MHLHDRHDKMEMKVKYKIKVWHFVILDSKPSVPYVYFCQSHIAAQSVYDIWEVVSQSGIG